MNIPKHIPVWSQLDFLEKFLSGAEYLWNFLFCAVWLYSIHNFSKNLSQSAYQKIDLHTCSHPTTKPMSAVFLLSPKFPENLILVHLLFHPTCSKMCLPPCALTTMSCELLMKVQSTICKSLSVPLAVSDVTKWHPSVVTGHSSIHDCCCLLLVLLFWRIFQVCSVSVGQFLSVFSEFYKALFLRSVLLKTLPYPPPPPIQKKKKGGVRIGFQGPSTVSWHSTYSFLISELKNHWCEFPVQECNSFLF